MKRIIIVSAIILLLILLIPFPLHYQDGGSVDYKAIIYCVTNRHSLWTNDEGVNGYLTGIEISVFGIEIYENVKFEADAMRN